MCVYRADPFTAASAIPLSSRSCCPQGNHGCPYHKTSTARSLSSFQTVFRRPPQVVSAHLTGLSFQTAFHRPHLVRVSAHLIGLVKAFKMLQVPSGAAVLPHLVRVGRGKHPGGSHHLTHSNSPHLNGSMRAKLHCTSPIRD